MQGFEQIDTRLCAINWVMRFIYLKESPPKLLRTDARWIVSLTVEIAVKALTLENQRLQAQLPASNIHFISNPKKQL